MTNMMRVIRWLICVTVVCVSVAAITCEYSSSLPCKEAFGGPRYRYGQDGTSRATAPAARNPGSGTYEKCSISRGDIEKSLQADRIQMTYDEQAESGDQFLTSTSIIYSMKLGGSCWVPPKGLFNVFLFYDTEHDMSGMLTGSETFVSGMSVPLFSHRLAGHRRKRRLDAAPCSWIEPARWKRCVPISA
jgi:hypothetical protein